MRSLSEERKEQAKMINMTFLQESATNSIQKASSMVQGLDRAKSNVSASKDSSTKRKAKESSTSSVDLESQSSQQQQQLLEEISELFPKLTYQQVSRKEK